VNAITDPQSPSPGTELLHAALQPFLDVVRINAEERAREKAACVQVEYREGDAHHPVNVGVTWPGSHVAIYGFGKTFGEAMTDLMTKIEPAPDLDAILGMHLLKEGAA
jgi:hypothetical protein